MCGLFGQINTKVEKFNYPIFCTLGVANDVRGGDSCGVFIDGKVEYGIDKSKHFLDFMVKSDLLENTKKCKIAFGHCRKTSVGTTSLETAQPVVIKEDNVIKYVLMHNGTIYNIEQLAKKYVPELDINGMSDSQVMARIFYAGHYEALKEYNGSAVFIIADYRKNADNPKILWFKGESRINTISERTDEERPLYFIEKNGTIYFSSLMSYLFPFCKKDDVYETDTNILYEVKNGDLYEVRKYDRTKQCQVKDTTVTTTEETKSKCELNVISTDIYSAPRSSFNSYNYYDTRCNDGNFLLPMPFDTEGFIDIDPAYITVFEDYDSVSVGNDLLFYIKKPNNLLHGGFHISSFGYISESRWAYTTECWFWQGVMLKNKDCFHFLTKVAYECNYDPIELMVMFPEIVYYFSVLPAYNEPRKILVNGYNMPYTGEIRVPFTKRKFKIEDGIIKETTTDMCNFNPEKMLKEFENYNPGTDDYVLGLNN